MKKEISNLTIRLPKELKEKALKKANSEGETLSVFVRRLLKDWVDEK